MIPPNFGQSRASQCCDLNGFGLQMPCVPTKSALSKLCSSWALYFPGFTLQFLLREWNSNRRTRRKKPQTNPLIMILLPPEKHVLFKTKCCKMGVPCTSCLNRSVCWPKLLQNPKKLHIKNYRAHGNFEIIVSYTVSSPKINRLKLHLVSTNLQSNFQSKFFFKVNLQVCKLRITLC